MQRDWTHGFLWWIAHSERHSAPARGVIGDELNGIVVNAVPAWEMAGKPAPRTVGMRV